MTRRKQTKTMVTGSTIAALTAPTGDGGAVFSPQQMRELRSKVLNTVQHSMPHAHEVMLGQRKWSHVQLQLFRTLVNKVLPDLNANHVQLDVNDKSLHELSREELERIAAGLDGAQGAQIEGAAAQIDTPPDTPDAET